MLGQTARSLAARKAQEHSPCAACSQYVPVREQLRVQHAAEFFASDACGPSTANAGPSWQAGSAAAPCRPRQGPGCVAHPPRTGEPPPGAVLPERQGRRSGRAGHGIGRHDDTTHPARCLPQGGVGVARDYDGGNTTGFVSPASDSLEGPIDLSEILDLRRPHRYPVRVKGDALAERGIQHGDILIADAAAAPASGRVVIAMIHGDVLVCQLAYRYG